MLYIVCKKIRRRESLDHIIAVVLVASDSNNVEEEYANQ